MIHAFNRYGKLAPKSKAGTAFYCMVYYRLKDSGTMAIVFATWGSFSVVLPKELFVKNY